MKYLFLFVFFLSCSSTSPLNKEETIDKIVTSNLQQSLTSHTDSTISFNFENDLAGEVHSTYYTDNNNRLFYVTEKEYFGNPSLIEEAINAGNFHKNQVHFDSLNNLVKIINEHYQNNKVVNRTFYYLDKDSIINKVGTDTLVNENYIYQYSRYARDFKDSHKTCLLKKAS